MPGDDDLWFQAFDCPPVPVEPGGRAAPRPPGRERPPADDGPVREPEFVVFEFDCPSVPVEPGGRAAPRPPGRERPPADPPAEVRVVVRNAPAGDLLRRIQDALRANGLDADVLPADSRKAG